MKKFYCSQINITFLIFICCSFHFSTQHKNFFPTEERRLFNQFSAFGNSMSGLIFQTPSSSTTQFKIGSKNDFFAFILNGIESKFQINYRDDSICAFNADNDVEILSSSVSLAKGLDLNGNLKVGEVNQWKMFKEETFEKEAEGWSNNTVTSCGGVNMLGGYCKFSSGESFKEYTGLPEHSQIRIQATYHFIDAWNGESGYMKIGQAKNEMSYYWTDKYSAFGVEGGINVCGGKWPEGKFASPIDVILSHKEESFILSFGSTLEMDACEESFGVSAIKIFIR